MPQGIRYEAREIGDQLVIAAQTPWGAEEFHTHIVLEGDGIEVIRLNLTRSTVMATSTSGAFRYAGLAAVPMVLALAFLGNENIHRDSPASGQGPQTQLHCIAGVANAACPAAPPAIGQVPFLGELTVTAPRSEFTAPAVRSAAERSRTSLPQVKATAAKFSSIL